MLAIVGSGDNNHSSCRNINNHTSGNKWNCESTIASMRDARGRTKALGKHMICPAFADNVHQGASEATYGKATWQIYNCDKCGEHCAQDEKRLNFLQPYIAGVLVLTRFIVGKISHKVSEGAEALLNILTVAGKQDGGSGTFWKHQGCHSR